MGVQQYEEELLEEIKKLPAEQVKEVLDFTVFLRQRIERERGWLQAAREKAAERLGARRKRIGPIGVKAADLVEEGRAVRATRGDRGVRKTNKQESDPLFMP